MRAKYPAVLLLIVVVAFAVRQMKKSTPLPVHVATSTAAAPAASVADRSAAQAVQPLASPAPALARTKAEALSDQVERSLYKSSSTGDTGKLRALARALAPGDLGELKDRALSDKTSSEGKIASVYILTQAGPAAFKALQAIAEAPINVHGVPESHSAAEAKYNREISIRITAMEALDTAGVDHSEIRKAFTMIFKHQEDPSLQRLALIALRGYEQGRLGKLHRYMDKLTASAN